MENPIETLTSGADVRRPLDGTPQINFRAGALFATLTSRASLTEGALSAVVKRDLHRYYQMLHETTSPLAPGDAAMLVEIMEPEQNRFDGTFGTLFALVERSCAERGRGNNLRVALLHANIAERLKIQDSLELYWASDPTHPPRQRLSASGLLAPKHS